MQLRLHPALLLIFCCLPCVATACGPQETTDQSQRLLSFPEQQPASPGVHVELLRRLRDALQQSRPEPQPLPEPQKNSDTAKPSEPQTATPPETISPEELLDLSQSLQNLADRIPPGLIPRGLSEMPPEQLQKSLQHPETQQSLRKLLEQFRSDGLLPQPSENGTPIPGPPRQTPPFNQPDATEPAKPQIGPVPEPDSDPDTQPAPAPQSNSPPRSGTPPRPAPQSGTIPRPNRPSATEPVPPADPGDTPTPNLSRDALRRLEDFFNELRQNSPSPAAPPNSVPGQPAPSLTPPPGTEQPQTPPNSSRRTPLRRRDRPQPGTPPVPPLNTQPNPAPNTQPGSNAQPDPATSPQSASPGTSRNRSLFESLERIFKEPSNQPSPGDTMPSAPVPRQPTPGESPQAQPPEPADPSQQPFSVPDFLKQQLNDPQLRNSPPGAEQPGRSAARDPSAPPQPDPSDPSSPTEPTDPTEPAPRTRPPVNLDPSQSFRDSFRQLLNEARQEAREQNSQEQQPRPNSPPADTAQTPPGRPQPPPPAPAPPPGPNRAESLLRMLDDLAKTPDRRPGESGLRPVPQPRSGDSLPRSEPPRSLLDNLLGGSQPQAPEPATAAEPPAPGESGDSPNSSSSSLDLSATPSALSLGATLAVALGVLWLLLKFAGQRRQLSAGSTGHDRPLPPDQIHGRPDIVAAYHQLARQAVRSFRPWWHHRQIETLLLQTFPGRQSAITQLAGVYEQSRYAPDSIPLSPTDLETAREAIRECQKSIRGS